MGFLGTRSACLYKLDPEGCVMADEAFVRGIFSSFRAKYNLVWCSGAHCWPLLDYFSLSVTFARQNNAHLTLVDTTGEYGRQREGQLGSNVTV